MSNNTPQNPELPDHAQTQQLGDPQAPLQEQPTTQFEQQAPAVPAYVAPQQPAFGAPAYVAPEAENLGPATQRPAQATTLGATNTYALLAIILAFISPLPAVIFGHMGLSQIKRNGDSGRGIALAGTIIGYVVLVSWAALIFLYMSVMFLFLGFVDMMFTDMVGSDFGYDTYDF